MVQLDFQVGVDWQTVVICTHLTGVVSVFERMRMPGRKESPSTPLDCLSYLRRYYSTILEHLNR